MHVKPPHNAKVWIGVWIGDCDVGAVGVNLVDCGGKFK
jgi:hypothetical protein